jgi:hypothetical protein
MGLDPQTQGDARTKKHADVCNGYLPTELASEEERKMGCAECCDCSDEIETEFNFNWVPYNLGGFYLAHRAFAGAYKASRSIDLEWVILVLGGLCYRAQYLWNESPLNLVRFWKRAYEGPFTKSYVLHELEVFTREASRYLGLSLDASAIDFERTMSFLSVNDARRADIDVVCSGPYSVFLPLGERVFIDYAWMREMLYSLFFEIKLSDQNFKGTALEELVRGGKSLLPHGP